MDFHEKPVRHSGRATHVCPLTRCTPEADDMKKIAIRKVETLKTTSALYACASCQKICDIATELGMGSLFGTES